MVRFLQLGRPAFVVAALGVLAGCRGPGSHFEPNFEAVLRAEGDAPEAALVSELTERRTILASPAVFDPGDPADRRITIRLMASDEAAARRDLDALCQSGQLTVRRVHDQTIFLSDAIRTDPSRMPADAELLNYSYPHESGGLLTESLVVHKAVIVDGSHIQRARPQAIEDGVIHLTLSPDGGRKMLETTKTMQKGRSRLAIILDDRIISAPVVGDVLSAQFTIQGFNSFDETKAVAAALTKPLSAKLLVETLKPLAPAAPKP